MSRNVGVSIHCYQGDAHQVRMLLPVSLHHGYPVYVVSPEDSPVHIDGVQNFHDGPVGYYGFHTWVRQIKQMQRLLTLDHEWFLLNDAGRYQHELL